MPKKQELICPLEEFFRDIIGFKLVHDGQRNPGQFKFPPEEVRCFTRRYRKGETGILFQYDLRREFKTFPGFSPVDVKFEFYSTELNRKGKRETYERVYSKGGK